MILFTAIAAYLLVGAILGWLLIADFGDGVWVWWRLFEVERRHLWVIPVMALVGVPLFSLCLAVAIFWDPFDIRTQPQRLPLDMQKLTEALATHTAQAVDDLNPEMNRLPLVVAAKEWASHALDTYSGDLLQKALAVSAALREFADEFNTCSPNCK